MKVRMDTRSYFRWEDGKSKGVFFLLPDLCMSLNIPCNACLVVHVVYG
uniref:Uncharacterized protein n=1 Tax=Rhizophora mucronata TaxID=61149 RepID=A0A2P2IN77_RHIMU